MEKVKLMMDEGGQGRFFIGDGNRELGEMVIAVSGEHLTVYHTEVIPEAEGKGMAGKLLAAMTGYAREKGLKVIPLCPYVHAQFRRHPGDYADIWEKNA